MAYKDPEKQAEYQREWYRKNKIEHLDRSKQCREARYEKIRQLKEAEPCVDCGNYYPYWVMQYDHISDDKVQGVAFMARTSGIKKVLEEIAKCELVCANCHATRTYNRLTG